MKFNKNAKSRDIYIDAILRFATEMYKKENILTYWNEYHLSFLFGTVKVE